MRRLAKEKRKNNLEEVTEPFILPQCVQFAIHYSFFEILLELAISIEKIPQNSIFFVSKIILRKIETRDST